MERIHISRSTSGEPIFEDPSSHNGRGVNGDVKKETFMGQSIEVVGKDKQGNIQAVKFNKGSLIDYLNTELELLGEAKLKKGWFIHDGDDKVLAAYQKIFSNQIQPKEVNSATSINLPEVQPDTFTPELLEHIEQVNAVETRFERSNMIDNMSLPLFSKVVLDTRKAIIKKVQESVPKDRDVIFLVGDTGSGKSTTTCFLRGDKMVLHNDNYFSENDRDHIIGHSRTESGTFLPNIAVTDNCTIVDFPGFEDTKGAAIALGIESALKALINEYHPKILVQTPITQDQRYTSAGALGSRLDRLLENKQDCTLGVTKYSQNPAFIEIGLLEKRKKENRANNANEMKCTLEAEINAIKENIEKLSKSPNVSSLSSFIESKQEKLKEKEQQLEMLQEKILNEMSEESNEYESEIENQRIQIQKQEEVLQKEIGVNNILRFDTFKNSSDVLNDLSRTKAISSNSAPHLNAKDEELIHNLLTDYILNADSFELHNFENKLQKTSLIEILLSDNSDAAQFMALPDIDPQIAKNIERKFVNRCIQDCIKLVIHTIDKLPSELKMIEQRKFLDSYGILPEMIDNSEKLDNEWSNIRRNYANSELALSPFLKHLMDLPIKQNKNSLEVKYHIWKLLKNKSQELS